MEVLRLPFKEALERRLTERSSTRLVTALCRAARKLKLL